MLISEIIYNNLIRLLTNLTINNADVEAYLETITVNQELIYATSEGLEAEILNLQTTQGINAIEVDFGDLIPLLDNLLISFPKFPNNRIQEVKLLTTLMIKLNETNEDGALDLASDLDTSIFDLVHVKGINSDNFLYYEIGSLENSIVLFQLEPYNELNRFISESNIPQNLLLHLISKVGVNASILKPNNKYVLIKSDVAKKKLTTQACVCLHLVKGGMSFHSPYEYNDKPNVLTIRRIVSGRPYQQFNDSLLILSEYNSQKDILDKYLRLYHVVENFMYKSPIVTIERDTSKKMFSIRDFQRIYENIKGGELDILKDLFKKILALDFNGTQTFLQYTKSNLYALYPNTQARTEKLNQFLLLLRVSKEPAIVPRNLKVYSNDEFPGFFAKLVYAIRCSLVHNRETEFHLTHESLVNYPGIDDAALRLIEKYLIPCLEEIVFNLIINHNTIVWYDKSTLKLWTK